MPRIKNTFAEKFLLNYGLHAAMVLIILVFAALNPNYLTFNNVRNIFEQSGYFIVCAIGATFALIIGEQDLSIGGVLAGLTILGATVMKKTNNITTGIVVMFAAAIIIGVINGLFVVKIRLPSFIATIAVGYVVRGLGAYYTDGGTVQAPKALTRFAWTRVMGIPVLLFIALVVLVVTVYILNFTTFGRTVYAFGANRTASRMMGLRTNFIGIMSYVICAVCCCIGAVMVLCRSGVARFGTLPSLQMECIAAAVIGGTSLTGGKGSLVGTSFGVLLMLLVQSGLNGMGVSSFWQDVFTGFIIIASIILDSYKTRSNM